MNKLWETWTIIYPDQPIYLYELTQKEITFIIFSAYDIYEDLFEQVVGNE